MGLLKRKEEKTEVISVRVPGSAKAELDELRQRAEAGGFDLAGSMRRWCGSSGRLVRSSASPPPQTRTIKLGATAAAVRCVQADQWYDVGVIAAAWSGLRLTPPAHPSRYEVGRHRASLPAASVQCIRECSKPAQWQCEVGLTCCARFLEGHVTHYAMTAGRANP